MKVITKLGKHKDIVISYDFDQDVMSIEEAEEYGLEFLKREFDIDTNIRFVRNNRLRSTLGAYAQEWRVGGMLEPAYIELSGELLSMGAVEIIKDTIRHECVHFALHILGKPYHDGDEFFEDTLIRLNTSSTKEGHWLGARMRFQCVGCGGNQFSSKKVIWEHHRNCTSECCSESIIPVGMEIHNGTGDVKEYPNLNTVIDACEEELV